VRPQWIERLRPPTAVATEFNDHVNDANLRALASLLSEDHRFIDSLGNMVSGKPACIAAWNGFFKAFPGYRNTFESFHEIGHTVLITGFSDCPNHMELTGPAIWTATVIADRLTEWRVFEDTAINRMALGIYY
jgi:ketosteroid isomerase-like protein